MTNRLTKKETTFVSEFIESGNGVKAALKAYDTENYATAGVIAHENLKKPKIIKAIEEALPDDLLNQIHLEGLYATKEVWKNNNESGEIEHVSDEADFQTRAKYLDMAYKRRGLYAPDKHVNVNVRVEPSDKIKSLARKMNYGKP